MLLSPDSVTCPSRSKSGEKNVWVTGASGLLGQQLVRALRSAGLEVTAHRRTPGPATDVAFDLAQIEKIEPAIAQRQPDWIIHAAANTSVDGCERDEFAAYRLHVMASAELARAAFRHGSRLIYVSTDSVYDGDRKGAHDETAAIRPLNRYASTKYDGEQASVSALPSTIVARVNFFGSSGETRGLAAWILARLRAGHAISGFTDVRFNPLFSAHLAELMTMCIAADLPGGIYNFGAADDGTKFEFARRIARTFGLDPNLVQAGTLAEAQLSAPRPRNTVMATGKLSAALNRPMPTIADGLTALLETA